MSETTAPIMVGYIDNRGRALLRLRVRGEGQEWQILVCEIDTGAEPMLLTSSAWVGAISALVDQDADEILTFADGSQGRAIYALFEVEWFGQLRRIDALAAVSATVENSFLAPGRRGRGANALLGRSLLANCRLTIDYGCASVTIEPTELAKA